MTCHKLIRNKVCVHYNFGIGCHLGLITRIGEEVGDICKKIDTPNVNKMRVTRDAIMNAFHNQHYCDM